MPTPKTTRPSGPAGPDDAQRSWRRPEGGSLLLAAAAAALIAAGLWAWWTGLVDRRYDYDEVQRAHSIWLASLGLRPYRDYFECHPPYFALLTPLARRFPEPCEFLGALRVFAACGNVLFLAGLGALAAQSLARGRGGSRAWALPGLAVVAFHPKILDYLIEFRIDGWGYALAAWSIVRFRRARPGPRRHAELGLLSGLASAFFCPKLVLLPPLIVLFEEVRDRKPPADRLKVVGAYGLGVALAGVAFGLFVVSQGIGLERTFLLLGRYHALSNANSAFRYGLARQVAATPLLLALIAGGAVAWLAGRLRSRALPDPYDAALGAWLVAQAALVTYPYKQYYAPWFLFASGFVGYLGPPLRGRWRPLGVIAFLAACGWTAVSDLGIAQLWSRYGGARAHCQAIRYLNAVSAPDDRVVAPPDFHPIDRRDAFYLWFNTSDPRGYDSERILQTFPRLRSLATEAHYHEELEAHPPAFIVLEAEGVPARYPVGQKQVLGAFLRERGYQVVEAGLVRLAIRADRVRLRPDLRFTRGTPVASPSVPALARRSTPR